MSTEAQIEVEGVPVFVGIGHGKPSPWDHRSQGNLSSIIVANFLSNEIALWAISNRVLGIITETGSFATHAANILRAESRRSGYKPIWITCVDGALPRLSNLDKVYLWPSGAITSFDSDQFTAPPESTQIYRVAHNREILKVQLPAGQTWRTYWPHRSYDLFTFSLMVPGLLKCCESIAGIKCTAKRASDGIIWFSKESPSLANLRIMVSDVSFAQGYLTRQIHTYRMIISALRSMPQDSNWKTALLALVRLLNEYFSVHLLIHDTYESLFAELVRNLSQRLTDSDLRYLMESLFRSRITDWQLEHQLPLRNRKDLLDEPEHLPIPEFGMDDDLESTISALIPMLKLFPNLREEDIALIKHASTVFVTKEWKFVINKLLYTRFACVLAAHLHAIPGREDHDHAMEHLRSRTINEVLED